MWAFSTAGQARHHPRFLIEAAAAARRAGPAAFKPHELSALAWAYGKAGLAHNPLALRHAPLLEARSGGWVVVVVVVVMVVVVMEVVVVVLPPSPALTNDPNASQAVARRSSARR